MICDQRPCFAGAEKRIAAEGSCCVHQSPLTSPTCTTEANEGVFAAEEPSHTPGIIPFSV